MFFAITSKLSVRDPQGPEEGQIEIYYYVCSCDAKKETGSGRGLYRESDVQKNQRFDGDKDGDLAQFIGRGDKYRL